jgi:DNA-binding NtrC family response regulator
LDGEQRDQEDQMNGVMMNTKEILVVDDETTICDLLKRGLTDDNFTVTSMTRARGVIEMVRERRPCLVILDLNLPDGNGLELLKEIKESVPEVPVVILSGMGHSDDIRLAVRLGACEYLKKPVDWRYLRNLAHLCSFLKDSSKK